MGYGYDQSSEAAISFIRKKIKNETAEIHFVCGGTQANLIVISALLKPHESIIAAETGHIATSEAGAIESTGHKINTVATENGKFQSANIKKVLDKHTDKDNEGHF